MDELFKTCFEMYYERLCLYSFTMVKENDEAHDIVQTAFINLWEKRREINFADSAKSYLYKSVYRLSLNSIRNHRTRDRYKEFATLQINATEKNPAEEKEIRVRINQAINNLPAACKEVFLKSRFEGKKYAEIASELEISNKKVEIQMGRALKILRQLLADLAIIWLFIITL